MKNRHAVVKTAEHWIGKLGPEEVSNQLQKQQLDKQELNKKANTK